MITPDRLREVLNYDPSTGIFTWRVSLSPVVKIGAVAGTITNKGRRHIAIGRRLHYAARLAWLYVYGVWPSGQIDHRNLNRLDDRIDNLRLASTQQNSANRRALKNNKLGVKGVCMSSLRVRAPQRYRARIRVNNVLIHLGYFSSPDAASEAYAKAASHHFGEFARSV